LEQFLPIFFNRHAKRAAKHLGSGAALPFGLRRQQICQSFGLVQIHSTVGKSASGKFARLRTASFGEGGNGVFNGADHSAATMKVKLNQIFPCSRF
jgi:hypothetical protein